MVKHLGHDTPLGSFRNLGSWIQRRGLGPSSLSILDLKTFYPQGFPVPAPEGLDNEQQSSTSDTNSDTNIVARKLDPSAPASAFQTPSNQQTSLPDSAESVSTKPTTPFRTSLQRYFKPEAANASETEKTATDQGLPQQGGTQLPALDNQVTAPPEVTQPQPSTPSLQPAPATAVPETPIETAAVTDTVHSVSPPPGSSIRETDTAALPQPPPIGLTSADINQSIQSLREPSSSIQRTTDQSLREPSSSTQRATDQSLQKSSSSTQRAIDQSLQESPSLIQRATDQSLRGPSSSTQRVTDQSLQESSFSTQRVTDQSLRESSSSIQRATNQHDQIVEQSTNLGHQSEVSAKLPVSSSPSPTIEVQSVAQASDSTAPVQGWQDVTTSAVPGNRAENPIPQTGESVQRTIAQNSPNLEQSVNTSDEKSYHVIHPDESQSSLNQSPLFASSSVELPEIQTALESGPTSSRPISANSDQVQRQSDLAARDAANIDNSELDNQGSYPEVQRSQSLEDEAHSERTPLSAAQQPLSPDPSEATSNERLSDDQIAPDLAASVQRTADESQLPKLVTHDSNASSDSQQNQELSHVSDVLNSAESVQRTSAQSAIDDAQPSIADSYHTSASIVPAQSPESTQPVAESVVQRAAELSQSVPLAPSVSESSLSSQRAANQNNISLEQLPDTEGKTSLQPSTSDEIRSASDQAIASSNQLTSTDTNIQKALDIPQGAAQSNLFSNNLENIQPQSQPAFEQSPPPSQNIDKTLAGIDVQRSVSASKTTNIPANHDNSLSVDSSSAFVQSNNTDTILDKGESLDNVAALPITPSDPTASVQRSTVDSNDSDSIAELVDTQEQIDTAQFTPNIASKTELVETELIESVSEAQSTSNSVEDIQRVADFTQPTALTPSSPSQTEFTQPTALTPSSPGQTDSTHQSSTQVTSDTNNKEDLTAALQTPIQSLPIQRLPDASDDETAFTESLTQPTQFESESSSQASVVQRATNSDHTPAGSASKASVYEDQAPLESQLVVNDETASITSAGLPDSSETSQSIQRLSDSSAIPQPQTAATIQSTTSLAPEQLAVPLAPSLQKTTAEPDAVTSTEDQTSADLSSSSQSPEISVSSSDSIQSSSSSTPPTLDVAQALSVTDESVQNQPDTGTNVPSDQAVKIQPVSEQINPSQVDLSQAANTSQNQSDTGTNISSDQAVKIQPASEQTSPPREVSEASLASSTSDTLQRQTVASERNVPDELNGTVSSGSLQHQPDLPGPSSQTSTIQPSTLGTNVQQISEPFPDISPTLEETSSSQKNLSETIQHQQALSSETSSALSQPVTNQEFSAPEIQKVTDTSTPPVQRDVVESPQSNLMPSGASQPIELKSQQSGLDPEVQQVSASATDTSNSSISNSSKEISDTPENLSETIQREQVPSSEATSALSQPAIRQEFSAPDVQKNAETSDIDTSNSLDVQSLFEDQSSEATSALSQPAIRQEFSAPDVQKVADTSDINTSSSLDKQSSSENQSLYQSLSSEKTSTNEAFTTQHKTDQSKTSSKPVTFAETRPEPQSQPWPANTDVSSTDRSNPSIQRHVAESPRGNVQRVLDLQPNQSDLENLQPGLETIQPVTEVSATESAITNHASVTDQPKIIDDALYHSHEPVSSEIQRTVTNKSLATQNNPSKQVSGSPDPKREINSKIQATDSSMEVFSVTDSTVQRLPEMTTDQANLQDQRSESGNEFVTDSTAALQRSPDDTAYNIEPFAKVSDPSLGGSNTLQRQNIDSPVQIPTSDQQVSSDVAPTVQHSSGTTSEHIPLRESLSESTGNDLSDSVAKVQRSSDGALPTTVSSENESDILAPSLNTPQTQGVHPKVHSPGAGLAVNANSGNVMQRLSDITENQIASNVQKAESVGEDISSDGLVNFSNTFQQSQESFSGESGPSDSAITHQERSEPTIQRASNTLAEDDTPPGERPLSNQNQFSHTEPSSALAADLPQSIGIPDSPSTIQRVSEQWDNLNENRSDPTLERPLSNQTPSHTEPPSALAADFPPPITETDASAIQQVSEPQADLAKNQSNPIPEQTASANIEPLSHVNLAARSIQRSSTDPATSLQRLPDSDSVQKLSAPLETGLLRGTSGVSNSRQLPRVLKPLGVLKPLPSLQTEVTAHGRTQPNTVQRQDIPNEWSNLDGAVAGLTANFQQVNTNVEQDRNSDITAAINSSNSSMSNPATIQRQVSESENDPNSHQQLDSGGSPRQVSKFGNNNANIQQQLNSGNIPSQVSSIENATNIQRQPAIGDLPSQVSESKNDVNIQQQPNSSNIPGQVSSIENATNAQRQLDTGDLPSQVSESENATNIQRQLDTGSPPSQVFESENNANIQAQQNFDNSANQSSTIANDTNIQRQQDPGSIPSAWSNLEGLVTHLQSGRTSDQTSAKSTTPKPSTDNSKSTSKSPPKPKQSSPTVKVTQPATVTVQRQMASPAASTKPTIIQACKDDSATDSDANSSSNEEQDTNHNYSQYLELLVQEVYSLLRQRLSLEQERRGPKYPR
ncbi:hypothetical protein [Leptothoe spongobia]|uniref:Uncharacterized protein n=1 Tax=Leptothoe spongobia TAU-MAC 1115 TaxID=1967444 RepID=A0A947DFD0_9CYAN|nr:hypothetical protein [Leptothoe spongobia]MBT9314886.1 hypothetical protein [Leptothoe spongobia TAU-MAC 1115]